MKSVLDGAQEKVPEHIWEGVSAGLDMAEAKRRTAVIWWRRTMIGAAAAAVIIFGFAFGTRTGQNAHILETGDTQSDVHIAVVEKEGIITSADIEEPEAVLMADAIIQNTPKAVYRPSSVADINSLSDTRSEDIDEALNKVNEGEETAPHEVSSKTEENFATSDITPWDDIDETSGKKVKTSVVLSGITGTSASHNKTTVSLMKRPSMIKGPAKTGITETSTNTAYGIPVSVGAGVKFDFNEKWSLGVGANYSLLTRKFYGTYTKAENGEEVSSTSSDIKNSQHYVGIPVNAYYNILDNKRVNLYTYAGGCVEKCVSDKYEVGSTGIVHSEKPEGVQRSANVGIGVEFMIGKHLGIYIDPSLRYYFDNDQPKSLRTDQPLLFGAEMGLRIKL